VLARESTVTTHHPDATTVADPDAMRRGIDSADHVELVCHDAHVGQHVLDRLTVGPMAVHHDCLDTGSDLVGHRDQPP